MGYLLIIVVVGVIIWWVNRNTFHWKTIVEYLWKQIYQKADMMAVFIKSDETSGSDNAKKLEKPIMIMGTLINAILDFVNYFDQEKDKEDEDYEEETFGYGRFNFDVILSSAKRDPEIFKRVLKK
ncbi:MAG: hypothetical protein PHT16_02930 [Candidatus Pacebacteria bacterium]|nr:hypothetical protein [Candidatus Paceibacterota bacterium]